MLDLIKKEEGFSSNVYKDTLGYDTVGYGFKVSSLSKAELELNGGKIEPMSKEVADEILELKINKLLYDIAKDEDLEFILSLDGEIIDILVSMAYQMGISGLKGFKKMLLALKNGDNELASREMLNSKWAKQTPNRAKRASEIVAMA